MKYLVTGGTGFIGSAVVNYFKSLGHDVDTLDCINYAGEPDRLSKATHIITCDIAQPINTRVIKGQYDYILHLAAETHVDNSIKDPGLFVRTNVLGTFNMLEFARTQTNLKAFLYFSTDEVFGPAPKGTNYGEWDRYNSGNPYAATKAGGEELALAYGNTYNLPVIITHTMNAYGATQHPEKFIPMTIRNVLAGNKVTIHGDKTRTISGSRFYIHVNDIASAVDHILKHGNKQDKYNIVGAEEVTNLEVAQKIAALLDKPLDYEIVDFHSSRPGHDLRYALNSHKLAYLGWKPSIAFSDGLKETIDELQKV